MSDAFLGQLLVTLFTLALSAYMGFRLYHSRSSSHPKTTSKAGADSSTPSL